MAAATKGGVTGGVTMAALGIFIAFLRRSARDPLYAQVAIGITPDCILINSARYSRPHVRSWAIRWMEPGGGSFVAVGSAPVVYGMAAGQAVRNSDAQKAAKQSYRITFDYGDQQVVAVGGMHETLASRVMEAIENSLPQV